MTPKDQAVALLQSLRGQYIISQALFVALESMQNRPDTERESSNEADMRLLMEQVFSIYPAYVKGVQAANEAQQTADVQ